MSDPGRSDATRAMRRKADLMVGLFVAAVVALLGGVVVLVAGEASGVGAALVVVGVVVAGAAVVVLRSISPEERARLVPPKPDPEP